MTTAIATMEGLARQRPRRERAVAGRSLAVAATGGTPVAAVAVAASATKLPGMARLPPPGKEREALQQNRTTR